MDKYPKNVRLWDKLLCEGVSTIIVVKILKMRVGEGPLSLHKEISHTINYAIGV